MYAYFDKYFHATLNKSNIQHTKLKNEMQEEVKVPKNNIEVATTVVTEAIVAKIYF